MNLVIKTLILWWISSAASQVIEKQLGSNEGVIVGPGTPVYYLTYPEPDYLKITQKADVFKATPAYNFYRDPKNRNETRFVNALVIADYYLYQNQSEQEIAAEVLKEWNKVDDYFSRLKNSKVKIVISGLIIPKVPNIWNSPKLYEFVNLTTYLPFYANYYGIPSTMENINNWVLNNHDGFDQYYYNLIVFMSNYFLYPDYFNPSEVIRTYVSFIITRHICENNPSSGLVHKTDDFGLRTAQLIATGLFIAQDQNLNCEGGHIMDFSVIEHPGMTWSECSEQAFQSLYKSDYDCLEEPFYLEEINAEEEDYDD